MKLSLHILAILNDAASYLYPESALFNEIMLSVRPPPTRAEFDSAMRRLENDGYVIGVTNELTGDRKWRISDRGRAALAEARS